MKRHIIWLIIFIIITVICGSISFFSFPIDDLTTRHLCVFGIIIGFILIPCEINEMVFKKHESQFLKIRESTKNDLKIIYEAMNNKKLTKKEKIIFRKAWNEWDWFVNGDFDWEWYVRQDYDKDIMLHIKNVRSQIQGILNRINNDLKS